AILARDARVAERQRRLERRRVVVAFVDDHGELATECGDSGRGLRIERRAPRQRLLEEEKRGAQARELRALADEGPELPKRVLALVLLVAVEGGVVGLGDERVQHDGD